MRALSIVLTFAAATMGCTYELPPPVTPANLGPSIATSEPVSEGNGRVVLDVVDGPTEVRRSVYNTVSVSVGDTHFSASAHDTERVCETPCIVELPLGTHRLGFLARDGSGRLELTDVEFLEQPTAYRRALGRYDTGGAGLVLGILGVVFGGISAVTGMALLPAGLASDTDGVATAGGITLGVGSALVALGIVGIALSPNTIQPGASTQYFLP